ncbi:hypothetical protein [Sphingobacterium thalpophilum]|uniref:Uncharacterized protein n=1 Tax=Sphingobacterium thalpophilum TaxID=259 RepID=A0A4U9VSZ5_9SPHI|nr:hypothetical protein [Sphingobacterium thalpophilum]VTR49019.1 Uncharacterised protein [Sphingobacterium thalpophilum]
MAVNINLKTVDSYIRRFNGPDLEIGELLSMEDAKLYDLFTEEDQTNRLGLRLDELRQYCLKIKEKYSFVRLPLDLLDPFIVIRSKISV